MDNSITLFKKNIVLQCKDELDDSQILKFEILVFKNLIKRNTYEQVIQFF